MPTNRTWEVCATQVRRDFTYLRRLMKEATEIMSNITDATDLSDSGNAYQLALEMAGVARQFEAWVVSQRRLRAELAEAVRA